MFVFSADCHFCFTVFLLDALPGSPFPPVILFMTLRKTVGVAWQRTWFLLYQGVRWEENVIVFALGWKEAYVPCWKCNLLLSWFNIQRPQVHNWPKQKGNSEIEIPWNWSTERISKSHSIYVCAHRRRILSLWFYFCFFLFLVIKLPRLDSKWLCSPGRLWTWSASDSASWVPRTTGLCHLVWQRIL